ncbi:MAG: transketolase [Coprobacillus sp.]|nr:transketolase [Coprobacillus sp.]
MPKKYKNRRIDDLCVATIRSLAIDMINKANSGHPGMALGSAPILYTLYSRHMRCTHEHSDWINRDRFIFSAGHASTIHYAILHLCGYNITMEDLKQFRQAGSMTPGHPEVGHTDGIDASTGPLGQGIAQGVGMALAEESLAANYTDGDEIIDHYTYVLCGDGCLEEGISQEAISFAGKQKLRKLILLYDMNDVTLDGPLSLSSVEDTKGRFLAAKWNVLEVEEGNDIESIDKAICRAKKSDQPTVIIVHTVIGYGSSVAGTSKAHGTPLGYPDGESTKKEVYHFPYEDFYVPPEVYEHFKTVCIARGRDEYLHWENKVKNYCKKHETDYERLLNTLHLDTSKYLPDVYPNFKEGSEMSTRNASGKALNDYMLSLPNLVGGCADVAASVMTKLIGGHDLTPECPYGHNINFGIREFAMASICNGMLLHDGIRTYCGCFLVFSDYMKPAIRMAAMMHLPSIYLFSHDSIAVGEDGPTHQPVEQVAMLRSIPGLRVVRPCDEREMYGAWHMALKSVDAPTALILSRQNLPLEVGSSAQLVEQGAYVISPAKSDKPLDLEIIATGSEVSLAVAAQTKVAKKGINVSVISMPCMETFERQSKEVKDSVLTLDRSKRLSIEMLSSFGWDKWAAYHMSVDTYGESGKAEEVIKKYHFTVDDVVSKIKEIVK